MGIKQFYADSKEKIEEVYKKVTIKKSFFASFKNDLFVHFFSICLRFPNQRKIMRFVFTVPRLTYLKKTFFVIFCGKCKAF